MANCSVLEAHQKPTDKPTKRIKRSGGHSLVRQGLAFWLIRNILLKMADPHSQPAVSARSALPKTGAMRRPAVYQHHIEPKLYKVSRRQMEELERWYASVSGDSL